MDSNKVLGNMAEVVFASFGNQAVKGKVDTGATTSSLHAEDIHMQNSSVSFKCPALSSNIITLELDGSQEVQSADGGGTTRPIVTFDVTIDGVPVRNASFNLNDRGNMDTPVLIGQNILQSGGFVIDPNKDQQSEVTANVQDQPAPTRESIVMRAIEVLAEHDVTLSEIITCLHTAARNKD